MSGRAYNRDLTVFRLSVVTPEKLVLFVCLLFGQSECAQLAVYRPW